MIYLDNSATTYPKPDTVVKSMSNSMCRFGANAGRGFYDMSIKTTEHIYNTREKIADFFGCENTENVIFTYNCTMSLNMAIKGVARKGGHFIISDLEHNSVLRTVEKLKSRGTCDYSIAEVDVDDDKTINNFSKCIRKNTVAIISTGASNVFGFITPFAKIGELAHKNNILFILDAAQIAGVIPINVQNDNIDILCCAGHKGLYGPSGTGVIIFNSEVEFDTIIEGGTGSNSFSEKQPEILPDRFESGTPNIPGIVALGYGVDFINKIGIKNIYKHEKDLILHLQKSLEKINSVNLYGVERTSAPILSFNVQDMHSEEVASILSKENIAVRAGFHCAPIAHKKMSTLDTGTVRISPSFFTSKKDIDFLIKCVRKFAK